MLFLLHTPLSDCSCHSKLIQVKKKNTNFLWFLLMVESRHCFFFPWRSAELRAPISGQHLWQDESALACPEMDVQDGWNRKKIAFMIRCKGKINLEKWHQKQQLGVDSCSNFKRKHCISIGISWLYEFQSLFKILWSHGAFCKNWNY